MIIYEVLSKVFGTTFTKSVDECVCIAKKNNGTGITRTVKNLLFYSHRNITFREQKAILLEQWQHVFDLIFIVTDDATGIGVADVFLLAPLETGIENALIMIFGQLRIYYDQRS